MKRGLLLTVCFWMLYSVIVVQGVFAATLSGLVSNNKGEALAFASVYIKGTSTGTTTNIEGYYQLELMPGNYEIVFQYVGLQQSLQRVAVGQENITLNIELQPLDLTVEEVIVRAGEDPAYDIIRKAIKKRKYYLQLVDQYSCDAYVKGTQYVEDMPEKFMGRSLGEFRKGLDSSGTGIVYLSESVSKLYFDGKKYKELMISSKVSGDDNGFSFNSGVAMSEFNFYSNQLSLGDAKLLSPIAQNALISYKYQLVNTFFDGQKMVYKIKVLPKNKLGQLFHGYIYIVDGEWCIHSTELKTTGKSANISMLDTIEFRQVHVPVQDSVWRLFSQDVEFEMKIFALMLSGRFTGVFRNYKIAPQLAKGTFNAEVFKVEENANKRDSIYWDSIRPVALSAEEQREYWLKDSLQEIWSSKNYMDSIDRINNRLGWGVLLSGYTYRNRYKRWRLEFPSPIQSLRYNTVQGRNLLLEATFTKGLDEDYRSWWDLKTDLAYGFSDRQFRGRGRIRYKMNDTNDAQVELEGGRMVFQYNLQNPIPSLANSLHSAFLRCNYMKLYERQYLEFSASRRLLNGLYVIGRSAYEQRVPLVNQSDFSWFRKDQRAFFSNQPLDFNQPPSADTLAFQSHRHWQLELFVRLRFAQKFISYPKRRFHIGSKYPDIWLHYRKGIPLLKGQTDFDYLGITIQKEETSLGNWGLLTWRAKYGFFPNTRNMEFMDYMHFLGNQVFYAKSGEHWRSYQLMPYYQFSTNRWFVEAHLHHDFNGIIWNKLPYLKQLGFEFVAGYHLLYTPDQGDYMEFTLGLDRLGWGLLRFARVDFVTAYQVGEQPDFGVVFSLDFSL